MKKVIFLVSVWLTVSQSLKVLADSPVTSTYWADAYKDIPIIAKRIEKVSRKDQVLTDEEIEYLVNDKNPFTLRAALINANGWNINGLNNTPKLLNRLYKKYGVKTQNELLEKANEYDLMVLAYLKIMDNYFATQEPWDIAFKAYKRHIDEKNTQKPSYAFLLIFVIIKGQLYLDNQNLWCDIYKNFAAVQSLFDEGKLTNDIKPEGVKPIAGYLGIYAETCNE